MNFYSRGRDGCDSRPVQVPLGDKAFWRGLIAADTTLDLDFLFLFLCSGLVGLVASCRRFCSVLGFASLYLELSGTEEKEEKNTEKRERKAIVVHHLICFTGDFLVWSSSSSSCWFHSWFLAMAGWLVGPETQSTLSALCLFAGVQ